MRDALWQGHFLARLEVRRKRKTSATVTNVIRIQVFSFFLYSLARTHLRMAWREGMKRDLGPVTRKSRKLFGPEKPFVKLRPAYSVKPVFSYVVKGIKIKITAKFRASRRLSFEDTKRIMSHEMRPKSLGTFEKQAPAL